MTALSNAWNTFTLDDLRARLVANAGSTTLEVKGPLVDHSSIQRQVGAFANSLDGGHLVLGVDQDGDRWVFEGMAIPESVSEPNVWLDSVLRDNRKLTPQPSTETRSFR